MPRHVYPLSVGANYCISVMFGFLRNPDVTGNGRSGGQERIQLIAIDYHTVTGTAGMECKGDRRSKKARRSESGTDSDSLTETQGRGDLEMEREGQIKQG